MNNALLYQIAATIIPGIGNVYTKQLVSYFGSAENIFKAKKKDLEAIEGIGPKRMDSILNFNFSEAEKEVAFIEKHKIKPLFFEEEDYPKRLLHCYDSPVLLYYKGTADLNAERVVAIVGTRNPSEYGRSVCEKLINELAGENITIISGLAFGIDTIAHRASLKNNIKTVGVLAHGLDRIYPSLNKPIAKQMVSSGGLLTEFRQSTNPDKQNFPSRNRIVAGMSDCIVVIESDMKGGSLITAELGNGYNRDVFAYPGRVSDSKSSGCNFLIKTNKAALVTSADDILNEMGWMRAEKGAAARQRELFVELPEDEMTVYNLLKEGQKHIDDIYLQSQLTGSTAARALLMLEMKGMITSLPGKLYDLS